MEQKKETQEMPNGGYYCDNTSWASYHDLTSDPNDSVEGNSRISLTKCRPTVAMETKSPSSSEVGCCEICLLQDADTCVVHFDDSHSSFCMDCAVQCYARGKFCPLCPKQIVYFYKYNNV